MKTMRLSLSILALGLGFVAAEPLFLTATADAQQRITVPRGLTQQQPSRIVTRPGLTQQPRAGVQPRIMPPPGAGMVAAGGGNMVAAGGGNMRR